MHSDSSTSLAADLTLGEQPPTVTEPSKWQGVKQYLTRQRKLPSGLVDRLHEQGLIYADQNQNAVFIRRSLDEERITGATLRGTAGEDNKWGLSSNCTENHVKPEVLSL
jgi:hypothetical protein